MSLDKPTESASKTPIAGDIAPRTSGFRSRLKAIAAFEEGGPLLILIVLALAIGIPNPDFFSPRALVAVLRQSAFIGIVACGMVYLVAMIEIDLAVGSIYGLSATIAALMIAAGVDPWISVGAAMAAGAAMGALNGALANVLAAPVIIISLGTLSAFRGLSLVLSDGRAITGMPREHAFFRIFGGEWLGMPAAIWIMAIVGVVLHLVFWRTRFGGAVRAIGSNLQAAQFLGLRVARTRVYVTALVGLLAGLGGVLALAFFKASDPSLGAGLELQVVAAVVIGGTSLAGGSGTLIGAFIGVVLINIISSGLTFYGVGGNWAQFVTGVVIVGAIALDRIIKRRRAEAVRV